MKYIQKDKESLINILKKEIYIGALMDLLSDYCREKMCYIENAPEMKEIFSNFLESILMYLSYYQLIKANINIYINSIPLKQVSHFKSQLNFELKLKEMSPNKIIKDLLEKITGKILAPVQKELLVISQEKIKQKGKAVIILKGKLTDSLENLIDNNNGVVKNIVKEVFEEYEKILMLLISSDIASLEEFISSYLK